MLKIKNLPVSAPIPSHMLPRDILPPEGTPGSATMPIELKIESRGGVFVARMKAGKYRRVLRDIDACEHGAHVILQAFLGPDGNLEEAGFTILPNKPKRVVPRENESAVS